jgi:hypothetical protein
MLANSGRAEIHTSRTRSPFSKCGEPYTVTFSLLPGFRASLALPTVPGAKLFSGTCRLEMDRGFPCFRPWLMLGWSLVVMLFSWFNDDDIGVGTWDSALRATS